MSRPWFRLYHEFITDPLIRMLAFEDQRHFVATLCLKASGALDKPYPSADIRQRVIASLLGLSEERLMASEPSALDAARQRLQRLGLIDENWQPINWDKRQFISDRIDPTAAERMRRYRNKRNQTVTLRPSESDTDTDTETEKRERARPARPAPRKRCPTEFQITPELMAWASVNAPDVNIDRETSKFRDWEFKAARSDWPATWRTWMRRAQENGPGRGVATWSPLRSADEIEAEEKARASA
jgi:hypothetical protein